MKHHIFRNHSIHSIRSLIAGVLLLSMLALTACSGNSDSKSSDWDLTKISDQLLGDITYTDTLSSMDDDLMDYLYPNIDTADISDKKIYISSGSTAEEIAVFQAVDEEAAKRIEEGLKKRIEQQIESFTDYVPEEVKRLEDAVLVRNGSYVALSVSGDTAKAKEILK